MEIKSKKAVGYATAQESLQNDSLNKFIMQQNLALINILKAGGCVHGFN